eukprot:472150_1
MHLTIFDNVLILGLVMTNSFLVISVFLVTTTFVRVEANMIPLEGILLDEHNLWRSMVANGDIDDQPTGGNIEHLLWEYQLQQLAQNFTTQCNAQLEPIFDNDTLNQLNFSFTADFDKFYFGYNTASVSYDRGFNLSHPDFSLLIQGLVDNWFEAHQQYEFEDPITADTLSYINGIRGQTRYIGCGIAACPIFECIYDPDSPQRCCPQETCIRWIYLNCYYFPSISQEEQSGDDTPYIANTSCTQCTDDRQSECKNGLCAACPSPQWFACQDDKACDQSPEDPCDDPEFALSCPRSCDPNCYDLQSTNASICLNQPPTMISTVFPSESPSIHPTDVPTQTPITTTASQTTNPTHAPSVRSNTSSPSIDPSEPPSIHPTTQPFTLSPSINLQTEIPTQFPSKIPFVITSVDPTHIPTNIPSDPPTYTPTNMPTYNPTVSPTNVPTLEPFHSPTFIETLSPSTSDPPTYIPTNIPSDLATYIPSVSPSKSPVRFPWTLNPTHSPTYKCGINFLPFSTVSSCTKPCDGGRMKKTRLVYYYKCESNITTYLGKQVISEKCNTHSCRSR